MSHSAARLRRRLVAASAVLLTVPVVSAVPGVSATTPTVDLVAHYEFSGDLTDSEGDSDLTADPLCSTEVTYLCFASRSFGSDANGTYMEWTAPDSWGAGVSADLTTAIDDEYTIAMTFSFDDMSTGGEKRPFSTGDGNGVYIDSRNGYGEPYMWGLVNTAPYDDYADDEVTTLVFTRAADKTTCLLRVVGGSAEYMSAGTQKELSCGSDTDTVDSMVVDEAIVFLRDTEDAYGSSGGRVYDIRVWSSALTPAQLTAEYNPAPPAEPPTAPTSVTAVGRDGRALVSWGLPTTVATPVSGYTARVHSAETGGTVVGSCSTVSVRRCSVRGLTNGTTYWASVVARSTAGNSAASERVPVTPRTVPGAPRDVTAKGGDRRVTISWKAPTDNGGSRVTRYVALVHSAAQDGRLRGHCNVTTTTCTVAGLRSDVRYFVSVRAFNVAGRGALSSPRVPVTAR